MNWIRPYRPGRRLTRDEVALCGLEADLLAAVIEEANLKGWLVHHETDSRRTTAGFPDLTMVREGHGVRFLELKVGNNRPTEAQWNWIVSARLSAESPANWGAIRAYCFWDNDREHISRVLDGIAVGYIEEVEP